MLILPFVAAVALRELNVCLREQPRLSLDLAFPPTLANVLGVSASAICVCYLAKDQNFIASLEGKLILRCIAIKIIDSSAAKRLSSHFR